MATSTKKPGTTLAKRKGEGLPAGVKAGQRFDSHVVVALMQDPELLTPEIVALFDFGRDDAEATPESIAERDFAAKSLEDLLGGRGGAIASKDFVGQVFSLTGVDYNPSDVEGGQGLPFYAVLHGVTPGGDVVHVTSGAKNIVRKAALAEANGWCPFWAVITQTTTSSNRTALNLEAAPKAQTPFPKAKK